RLRGQVVPVGGRRHWRRGAGPIDRPLHPGTARLARPDRRPVDRRCAQRQDTASGGDQVLIFNPPPAQRWGGSVCNRLRLRTGVGGSFEIRAAVPPTPDPSPPLASLVGGGERNTPALRPRQ